MAGLLTQAKSIFAQGLRCLPGDSTWFGPPRTAVASTAQWYATLPEDEAGRNAFHLLAEEQPVVRRLPQHADEPIASLFAKMTTGKIAEQFVVEIDHGRYWGRWYGYVIAPGDKLIADISPTSKDFGNPLTRLDEHEGLRQPFLPPPEKLKGSVLSINTLFCSNYHHFLLDALPKIGLAGRAGIPLSDIDLLIFDYRASKYQNECLERLGISREKVISSKSNSHFICDRLIVPSYSEPGARVLNYQYTPEGMQFVRDLFLNDTPKPKRRILLSRRAAKNRRWVEEERALPELQKMGFERYEFETLSVAEQAKMFSEAEVVIMPHGGGLANCVFCSPGTHVIELFSNAYLPTFMMSLSDRLDLNYHAFVGRTKEIPGEREKDIDVPADRIIQYVRKLLGA